MKKRMALFLMAGMLFLAPLLSGCQSAADEKMQEYKVLGISQMEAGDYESAVNSFQKALDQSAGSIGAEELDICYYKALALYKSGDTEGAIEAYTALVEYDSKNWEVYYLRGNVYLQEGQTEEALADYAQAVSLNGNDMELCAHIYENLVHVGMEESGQEYLTILLSTDPSDAEEYYYLGDVYYLTGDYENAKTNLLQAQELGYDKALLLLGRIYAAEGDDEGAKAAFESYMEMYPDDAEALNELGEIALEAGEYENAVTYLEAALEASDAGANEAVLKNLIIAYEYTYDFQSACDMAEEYLSRYSDEEIEREYEFLQTRVGEDIESASEDEETTTEDEETTDENEETTDENEETTDGTESADESALSGETGNTDESDGAEE
ncbi:MAG: tetratricopeptide repeat protein [Clostridiales bacterium]|nr:tetratricopeptide repeat protein [Clostridiales bacterium]